MAITNKYTQNSTVKEEHKVACVKCSGKTVHLVMASYDQRADYESRHGSISFTTDNQVIQCQGCKTVSFRQATSNSDDYYEDEDGDVGSVVDESIYPSRAEGIKGIEESDRFYLPTVIRRIYEETLQALAGNSPVLTGIGLRALLESVCKEKQATGKDLFHKIDSLITAQVLTPASAGVLHQIRTLGNSAAHEAKPHNERQLGLALAVVEHLLLDVYILPKKMQSEFGVEE